MTRFGMWLRLLPYLCLVLAAISAGPAHAACTSPAGNEADKIYNHDFHTFQFCNGTAWIPYHFGYAWNLQANNNPTYPAGVGFFVMTKTTYNGNLGGLSGANASCLTDLTTNTGWKGYATANSRGQLISAKVFAFLCVDNWGSGTCNNLTASTTYYFANSGDSGVGGASFTTDGTGAGPNDSADWAAANYFSGSYSYWSSRAGTGTTAWPLTATTNGSGGRCQAYTESSSSDNSILGVTYYTTAGRWAGALASCDTMLPLVCYVNP